MSKKIAAIFDMDGTLSCTKHRQHFMEQQPKDWLSFYEGMVKDPPKHNIIRVLEMCKSFGDYIIIVTGRPDNYRQQTEEWLRKNDVTWDALFMRKEGCFKKDFEIKEKIYRDFIEPDFNVWQVWDDRTSVVNMWRQIGLNCAQVAPGDF